MPSSSPLRIYLATPCYGGMAHAQYMRSLLALGPACDARGVGLRIDLGGGEALIGRARAGMMELFLRSPATHLLFIDADIGFAPEDVFRLLDAGKDVVGGAYPRRTLAQGSPQPEYEILAGAQLDAEGLVPAAFVGTGFLAISRHAAERMADAYKHLRARLGDVSSAAVADAVMVFDSLIDPDNGRYLSEFEAFCRRWRNIGGEVWLDPAVQLTHRGDVELRLAPSDCHTPSGQTSR